LGPPDLRPNIHHIQDGSSATRKQMVVSEYSRDSGAIANVSGIDSSPYAEFTTKWVRALPTVPPPTFVDTHLSGPIP